MNGVGKYINLFESEIDAIFEEGEEEFEPGKKKVKIERFTDEELEELHEWLNAAGQMDVSEVKNFVMDHVADWPRGSKSLRNAAVRMYMLMHGEQPTGMISNPESDWFSKEKMGKIFDFMDEKGYNVGEKLDDAQRKGQEDWDNEKSKKTKDQALKLMGDKFKEIRDSLGKDQIEKLKKARHDIIDAIMDGAAPDEVFDNVLSS